MLVVKQIAQRIDLAARDVQLATQRQPIVVRQGWAQTFKKVVQRTCVTADIDLGPNLQCLELGLSSEPAKYRFPLPTAIRQDAKRAVPSTHDAEIGRASCRERVCQYV